MDLLTDYSTYDSAALYREWRWQEIRGKKFTIPLCNCPNASAPGQPWTWHAHSRFKCKTFKRPKLAESPNYCSCDLTPSITLLKYDGHWRDGRCEEHLRRKSEDSHHHHELHKDEHEHAHQPVLQVPAVMEEKQMTMPTATVVNVRSGSVGSSVGC